LEIASNETDKKVLTEEDKLEVVLHQQDLHGVGDSMVSNN
jgi:hypothetical protein